MQLMRSAVSDQAKCAIQTQTLLWTLCLITACNTGIRNHHKLRISNNAYGKLSNVALHWEVTRGENEQTFQVILILLDDSVTSFTQNRCFYTVSQKNKTPDTCS